MKSVQNEINNKAMVHRSILKIRQELVEFISDCAKEPEALEIEPTILIDKISNLQDYEVLNLYIRHTFEYEWRGVFIEEIS